MIGLIIVLVVIVLLIILFAGFYNRFVGLRNRVDNAWAQIDVQLQRRHDLIPNLVQTVQGYAAHESGTFQKVTEARTAAMNARTVEDKVAAENILSDTLKSLFAVSEAYPDLKANQNFLDLQNQLRDTEDKISIMRQSYNDTVMMFNNSIQKFPGNLFASMFHFTPRTSFTVATGAAEAPQVIFVKDDAAAQPAAPQAAPAAAPQPAPAPTQPTTPPDNTTPPTPQQ